MQWQPIHTAPVGVMIDVWLWDCGDDGQFLEGYRLPDARIIDKTEPVILEIPSPDELGVWHAYHPDQNAQWASHWMPKPDAPPLPEPPQ